MNKVRWTYLGLLIFLWPIYSPEKITVYRKLAICGVYIYQKFFLESYLRIFD